MYVQIHLAELHSIVKFLENFLFSDKLCILVRLAFHMVGQINSLEIIQMENRIEKCQTCGFEHFLLPCLVLCLPFNLPLELLCLFAVYIIGKFCILRLFYAGWQN